MIFCQPIPSRTTSLNVDWPWPRLSSDQGTYLDIGDQLIPNPGLADTRRFALWDVIYKREFPATIIVPSSTSFFRVSAPIVIISILFLMFM